MFKHELLENKLHIAMEYYATVKKKNEEDLYKWIGSDF